jgi:hypothetical protein
MRQITLPEINSSHYYCPPPQATCQDHEQRLKESRAREQELGTRQHYGF